jgi:polyisoprenoid-binding protein YceI
MSAAPTVVEPGTWRSDRARSEIGFRVRHFGVATVRGSFQSFDCRLEARDGALRLAGHADVVSVESGNEIRDARLRSEFFDAEHHPRISLCARLERRRAIGELTIRGVTRPVELALQTEALDAATLRLRADGRIRRSDFGLEWAALSQAGRLLVADEVRLLADVVVTRA